MDQRSILYLRLATGLVAGAIAGAIAALLIAPHTGRETRQLLNSRGEQLLTKANSSLAQTRGKVSGWFGRQDQAAAALIMDQNGLRLEDREIMAE
jgi:gas vesicle protein